jgi:hypothetical protein
MIDTTPGVEIKLIWFDNDMIELQIKAANDRLAGQTIFYDSYESPKDFAKLLIGFPENSADSREFEFGDFGGNAKFKFECLDKVGHCVLNLTLIKDSDQIKGSSESVTLCMKVEPAAIDDFVRELGSMQIRVGDAAKLGIAY